MKQTKKIFALLVGLALLLSCTALPSCGDRGDASKLKILCTVFPVYDWVRSIVGDSEDVEVSLLVENGTDLHSFQPSFGDMAKIKDSELVIYIGGDSDRWVADSVDEYARGVELSAIEGIELYAVSADSIAHAHAHGDGEECHEEHNHDRSFDEHLWLSPRNAATVCRYLADLIAEADSASAELYRRNAEAYIARLDALDARMSALAENITEPLIFADRFPFVYLLSPYNIPYFAAFEGCSTDTGADFDTVITLARLADEHSSDHIFVTEAPIDGLAASIIAQTSEKTANTVTLDSMQSLGKGDIGSGASYLGVMEQNISTLENIYR